MQVVVLLPAVVIGLGALAVALGVIGRRRGDTPRCAACGTDVRFAAFADEPRCSCGASLVRFGSVRTGVWRRSRRLIIIGTFGVLIGVSSLWITFDLRRPTAVLPHAAPWWLLMQRVDDGDRWPWPEIRRRMSAGEVAAEDASSLLVRLASEPALATAASSFDSYPRQLAAMTAQQVPTSDTKMHAFAAQRAKDAVLETATPLSGVRGSELSVALMSSAQNGTEASFLMLDEVLVDGVPARWTRLDEPAGTPWRGPGRDAGGPDPITLAGAIRVQMPPGIDQTRSEHTLLLRGAWGMGWSVPLKLLRRALAEGQNSGSADLRAPATWDLRVFGEYGELAIPFTLTAPDDTDAEAKP